LIKQWQDEKNGILALRTRIIDEAGQDEKNGIWLCAQAVPSLRADA
jgi:hypothetical protein